MGATSQLRRVLCFAKSGQSNKNRQTRVSSGYLSSIVRFARGAPRHATPCHATPLVTGVNRLIRFHREIVSHNRLLLMRQLHRADCHFVTRKNIAMGPSSPSQLLFFFYDSLHSSVDPRSTNIKGSWKRCLSVGFFFLEGGYFFRMLCMLIWWSWKGTIYITIGWRMFMQCYIFGNVPNRRNGNWWDICVV